MQDDIIDPRTKDREETNMNDTSAKIMADIMANSPDLVEATERRVARSKAWADNNTTRVLLAVEDNLGYTADQVETSVTLGDLLYAVEQAVEEHGEEALVLVSNGQRYGARFGRLDTWGGLFKAEEDDEF